MEELINRVAKAPLIAKIGGALLLVSVVTLLNYLLLVSPVESTIEMQRGQQRQLESQLAEKQEIAQNLTDYRRELETLEQKLAEALTELPNNASLDELLAQFNDVGKKAGLQISRVQPGGESKADFYARIPVKMEVTGNYNEVALFFQEVGNLRRIVNVSDITLKGNGTSSDKVILTADFLATTFRFLDQTSNAGDKKGAP